MNHPQLTKRASETIPLEHGSEVTTLKQGQVCFAEHTFVQLVGKGRKERTIPLWADTARVLRGWFQELGAGASHVAFPSARGAG